MTAALTMIDADAPKDGAHGGALMPPAAPAKAAVPPAPTPPPAKK